MAKWWKDRDEALPRHIIKIPPQPSRESHQPEEFNVEDIGDVVDDHFDEVDDAELPDRGIDE